MDNNLRRPLHVAAQCGNVEAAARLVEAGACVDVEDMQGGSPVHVAELFKHPPVAEYLKAAAAKQTGSAAVAPAKPPSKPSTPGVRGSSRGSSEEPKAQVSGETGAGGNATSGRASEMEYLRDVSSQQLKAARETISALEEELRSRESTSESATEEVSEKHVCYNCFKRFLNTAFQRGRQRFCSPECLEFEASKQPVTPPLMIRAETGSSAPDGGNKGDKEKPPDSSEVSSMKRLQASTASTLTASRSFLDSLEDSLDTSEEAVGPAREPKRPKSREMRRAAGARLERIADPGSDQRLQAARAAITVLEQELATQMDAEGASLEEGAASQPPRSCHFCFRLFTSLPVTRDEDSEGLVFCSTECCSHQTRMKGNALRAAKVCGKAQPAESHLARGPLAPLSVDLDDSAELEEPGSSSPSASVEPPDQLSPIKRACYTCYKLFFSDGVLDEISGRIYCSQSCLIRSSKGSTALAHQVKSQVQQMLTSTFPNSSQSTLPDISRKQKRIPVSMNLAASSNGGSLLNGQFDEEANAREFQEALQEFRGQPPRDGSRRRTPRRGSRSPTDSQASSMLPGIGKTRGHKADVLVVRGQEEGGLLDGRYDEEANALEFQEALKEWRGGDKGGETRVRAKEEAPTGGGGRACCYQCYKVFVPSSGYFCRDLQKEFCTSSCSQNCKSKTKKQCPTCWKFFFLSDGVCTGKQKWVCSAQCNS
ncbi:hypothetical protein CYMTET_14954 [Cymbomonas tetramitiformis]|uniref:Uncharacterized protein n=1 Tax=Cymbomonas tetramitiformis TaxID=36881 RepID=A0AAE0GFH9_9CHLO|nr:hypothetical protein CYMTET_14954 [Cymbomonas tetramitiformis]